MPNLLDESSIPLFVYYTLYYGRICPTPREELCRKGDLNKLESFFKAEKKHIEAVLNLKHKVSPGAPRCALGKVPGFSPSLLTPVVDNHDL